MIQGTFREVANINAEIAGQTGDFIVTLARVRLGAAVGIAVLGAGVSIAFVSAAAAGSAGGAGLTIMGVQAGAGAGTFGLTGLGYSMTNSLIKSLEGAPQAKVAAISTDAAKFSVSEGLGHVAGKTMDLALARGGKAAHIIRSAEGEIRKYSERLAQEGLKSKAQAKATNIIANATARKTAQEQIVAKSGQLLKGGRVLGTAVPVVFAAWDIMDAWGDYGDTVGAVR